jgi:hypothetical protein
LDGESERNCNLAFEKKNTEKEKGKTFRRKHFLVVVVAVKSIRVGGEDWVQRFGSSKITFFQLIFFLFYLMAHSILKNLPLLHINLCSNKIRMFAKVENIFDSVTSFVDPAK